MDIKILHNSSNWFIVNYMVGTDSLFVLMFDVYNGLRKMIREK